MKWAWSFGGGATPSFTNESDPVVSYPEGIPGTFPIDLKVWNVHDCVDSISATIDIINDVNIFAPNVFTPDNDEYNNTWRVLHFGY